MSFSADIKNELCSVTPTQCCLKAEAFGLLLFGRSFSFGEISFMTEQKSVAMRYCDTLRTLTGVIPVISCSKAGNYKIRIEASEDRKKVLSFFGYTGKELALRVNFSNFENNEEECCFKSFIRGAFLACGSISNPEKDYHLEFGVAKSKLCDDLMTVIEEAGLKVKKLKRSNGYLLYCKDAEGIEDFLGAMGANSAFFVMMETRAFKTVKNKINRRMNFEAANLSRTIETGMNQIDLINDILKKISLDDMTDDLAQLASLRLDNPDLSLDALGKLMNPPMSRSAVSRRFKKLKDIKEEVENR